MKEIGEDDMTAPHTAASATAADIEQETSEIEKERRIASDEANNKENPHGHALASILGPAFVAAVAYVDPGNVAANITSGARYGYLLVWVLVLANAMSVLIQYQSAKLGIVTNKSLPELLGERMSDAGRFMFFMQAEVIAIATDLAEVIGGAKGLIPRFKGTDSVLMAASILGATVMPHAIYLHSTLVNDHYAGGEKPSVERQLKGSKIDVAWALLLAGTVNLAMLVLAANSLHGMSGTDSIDGAQRAIAQVLGPVIGMIFSIGLLASSLSSTSVGTYAGSEIMHGLLHVNAPMWACRVVTLVPALIVLWFAKDPTEALVIGQVVLSIGIPFAVIPLMRYTHSKELMGKWADGTIKHIIFLIVVALIVTLNVLLIVLTLMGRA